jgi:hypothetical protein
MLRLFFIIASFILLGNCFGQKVKPPSPYSSKKEQEIEDRNQNCIKSKHYSFSARLKTYPFNLSSQIQLVSFKNDCCEGSLPIINDTIQYSKIIEVKTLLLQQVDNLTDILYNYGYRGPTNTISASSCYIPRNAILFLDSKGNVIEFIEICFQCRGTRESSRKIDIGEMCEQKFDMLRAFFKKAGIEYGAKEIPK